VAEAHWRWKLWKQLFMGSRDAEAESKERIRLMNSAASAFFGVVKKLLVDDVILRVCRLGDRDTTPTRSGLRENLSLANAFEDCKQRLSSADAATVEQLVRDFKNSIASLVDYRNRVIAHEDLLVALGTEKTPPFSDTDLDRALEDAVSIMKLLDPWSPGVEYGYKDLIVSGGDGKSLIYALRCADRYHKDCLAAGRRPLD
jgi:hypothetical protein